MAYNQLASKITNVRFDTVAVRKSPDKGYNLILFSRVQPPTTMGQYFNTHRYDLTRRRIDFADPFLEFPW